MTGCPTADVVLSVDKLVLSFARAEVVDLDTPCTAPVGSGTGQIPEGTCAAPDDPNPELHRPGAAVRKALTVSNNSNQAYTVTASFLDANGEALAGQPFVLYDDSRTQLDSEQDDDPLAACSNPPAGPDLSALTINAGAELELTVFFCGAELGVNNARLWLRTPDVEVDDVAYWSEQIVLQGEVDCVSLGWDQDMDGFCAGEDILGSDPNADCDDSTGAGHRANPGIEEETCERDADDNLIDQVDNDCDGFKVRPSDEDGDGICSFDSSCVVEGADEAALIAELEILCGSSEDDCLDGEADCVDADDPIACLARAAEVFPGNQEVCEPGDLDVQLDSDCNSENDRNGMVWYLRDQDSDGFGEDPSLLDPLLYCGDPSTSAVPFARCIPTGAEPTGDVLLPSECQLDCNDGIATVFPGAQPLCDGVDTDCDGNTDPTTPPANPPTWWDVSMNVDEDLDNDGRPKCSGLDCDDTNNDIFVGAAELCDGEDNNCDFDVPEDEEDNDLDDYVECSGVPPTAQVQVAGQPTEELVLFANPGLSIADAFGVTVEVVSGSAEALVEDIPSLTVTVTFDAGASTTTSMNQFITGLLALPVGDAARPQLISLVIGNGEHIWSAGDEECVSGGGCPYAVTGTLGGDCNDDSTDPAAPGINPGASELNGAGQAICDGQDNDCDGIGHPNETDDDLDGYAECAPSSDVSGDGIGGELLTITGPAAASGANITLEVQSGGSESLSEVIGTRTLTLTYVSGTSTTTSLAATIQAALSGLVLADAVDGSGTSSWGAGQAATYTLVNIAGGDCNDNNPEINLAATEVCDGYDNDCDGNVPATEVDQDGDGYVVCTPNSSWLGNTVLGAAGGNDCEDNVLTQPFATLIYPGAPEIADSYYDAVAGVYVLVDNQCPGDAGYDADGIPGTGEYCESALTSPANCMGSSSTTCYSCSGSELDLDGDNISPAAGDCDDTNAAVNNQALEICDGFDNDCDGVIPASELDNDGDDYVICNPAPGVPLAGTLTGGGDCDDTDGTVNPGEAELADGQDTDCDETTNDPDEVDADGDGYCPGGFCVGGGIPGDCDDGDASVNPGAAEICDELDTDCDALLSDGSGGTLDEVDDDGDGFTVCDPSQPTSTTIVNDCLEHASQITAAIPGYPLFGADNYPANAAAVHPTAPEVCDGWDNDCSSGGFMTSATVEPLEFDNDGDDYVDCQEETLPAPGTATFSVGWSLYVGQANRQYQGAFDCADISADTANTANPSGTGLPLTDIYPGAPTLCDGWDNDCTGNVAPFVDTNDDEFDDDGDRFLECIAVTISTGAVNPAGDTILGGYDCLDDPSTEPELNSGNHPQTGLAVTSAMAASVNPNASETCDGWNTDCDASGPTVLAIPQASDIPGEMDDDLDEYIACNNFVSATGAPGFDGDDCLDVALSSNAYSDDVNPAATETCDSWDTDCANQPAFPANDGLPSDAEEIDDDGDTYVQCDFSAAAIAGGAVGNGYGGVESGSDCLDVPLASNAYSNSVNPGPGISDVCDSYDTDCDSQPAYPNNDGFPEAAQEVDDDGDTYVQCTFGGSTLANGILNNGYGSVIGDDDCLDETAANNPYAPNVNTAATEVCDGWDTDCGSQGNYPSNTGIPSGAEVDELDQDGDLYIQCGTMVAAALGNGPNNEVGGDDCLDVALTTNAYSDDVNPAATETCDSWDTDCANQPA
ncbi:MAG: putative metal-binding motif-containing protein, partial [Deltaproteobacteria bacterium]|nr:putative metal-binding motif-containing protein [Deltaproteobacteria bacterium]